MFIWVAPIVKKNPHQESVRPPVSDVEGEIAAHRGEAARLHDIGENIGAHLRAPVAHLAERARRHVGGHGGDQERNDKGRDEEGS